MQTAEDIFVQETNSPETAQQKAALRPTRAKLRAINVRLQGNGTRATGSEASEQHDKHISGQHV